MLLEILINPLFGTLKILMLLIPKVPDITLEISNMVIWLSNLLSQVSYVLPLDTLVPIFLCYISIKTYKFWFNLIKTIWEMIPFN
jgi:hypothetical protein